MPSRVVFQEVEDLVLDRSQRPGRKAPTMSGVTEEGWTLLETWLRQVADDEIRKDGSPMSGHWIRVGRALRRAGADDITVCGGYGHDIVEDCPHVSQDNLSAVFEAVLGGASDAADALRLVIDCSYTPAEYHLERDVAAVQGKAARKAAACGRWLAHEDPRVWAVKIEDVNDNEQCCDMVATPGFAKAYRSWAVPLRNGLAARVSAAASASSIDAIPAS